MGCGTFAERGQRCPCSAQTKPSIGSLLNQAPGFELNLFAKEPLKRHCYNVNESVSQFGIEFVTVPQN